MNVEHDGMMTYSANQSSLRETCPIVTLSTTDHTWTALRSSPGLCNEKQAAKCLSCSRFYKPAAVVPSNQRPSTLWIGLAGPSGDLVLR